MYINVKKIHCEIYAKRKKKYTNKPPQRSTDCFGFFFWSIINHMLTDRHQKD